MSKVLEFSKGANRVRPKRILEYLGFLAEFFINEKTDPPVYHYVVMRKGSVEILAWGQDHSAESAERNARNSMEMLSQRTTQVV